LALLRLALDEQCWRARLCLRQWRVGRWIDDHVLTKLVVAAWSLKTEPYRLLRRPIPRVRTVSERRAVLATLRPSDAVAAETPVDDAMRRRVLARQLMMAAVDEDTTITIRNLQTEEVRVLAPAPDSLGRRQAASFTN